MEPNKQSSLPMDFILKKHTGGYLRFVLREWVLAAMQEWADLQTKDKDALIAQLREEVARYKSNCDAYIKVVEQLQQENQRLREGFMNQRPE